jgi:hypothetical protein
MIGARRLALSPAIAAFLGGGFCFALRVVSVSQQWNLPHLVAP